MRGTYRSTNQMVRLWPQRLINSREVVDGTEKDNKLVLTVISTGHKLLSTSLIGVLFSGRGPGVGVFMALAQSSTPVVSW